MKSGFLKFKRIIKRNIRDFKLKYKLYPTALIVKPEQVCEKIHLFIEETDEVVQMIPTYNFIKEGKITFHLPEVALWKFENVIVANSSDIVLLEGNKAVWQKYYSYNYSHNIPFDSNLIQECNGVITYTRSRTIINVDCAFSLLGVFSDIWAHAIVEYFPKIYTLKYAIEHSSERITVLVPEYNDHQLYEIIMSAIHEFDVDILVVKSSEAIKVKNLYYLERPTKFPDHSMGINPGDCLIPKTVADILKQKLVAKHSQGLVRNNKYKKMFLPRRGGLGKGIINSDEIEKFFKTLGFYFFEPHKVSITEKVAIFQSAEILVGPSGSAFSNLFLCRPNTKAMIFSNYQRLFESYGSMFVSYFGVNVMYVTGMDDRNSVNLIHCSYKLSLDKVKTAAKEFGIID